MMSKDSAPSQRNWLVQKFTRIGATVGLSVVVAIFLVPVAGLALYASAAGDGDAILVLLASAPFAASLALLIAAACRPGNQDQRR